MRKNKLFILLIALYGFVMLSVISWGLPSDTRPFTYNMDEWHQLNSVRYLFSQGTPNVPGAAHGSIFQFLLSGIYLIPFVIFKIVDPFSIHSLVDSPAMQERLFIILRSNTLLLAILSIVVMAITAKRYLASNSLLTALLIVGTPIWLTLSSYFKYDIALIFWICLSVLLLLRYGRHPTFKNFLYAAIPCSLAFATKLSAIPILPIYVFSFFWFTPHWRKKYKYLVTGLMLFLGIFAILGIPDLFFRLGDYKEYLSSNLTNSTSVDRNFILGTPHKWIYIMFTLFPIIFGHIFYPLFLLAFTYWFVKIFKWFYFKKYTRYKNEIFLLFCLIIFLLSLFSLGLGAAGNRALVLLPFFTLLSVKFIRNILVNFRYKRYFVIIISILVLAQFYESSVVIYAKYSKSVLQRSSEWIVKNIPKGTVIGVENIPIYQTLPDVALKEYYLNMLDEKEKTNYKYEVLNRSAKSLPKVIVITNRFVDQKYKIKSSKKDLLNRLYKENYKVIQEFMPNPSLYKLYNNHLDYYLSGLNFVFPVTIYIKD